MLQIIILWIYEIWPFLRLDGSVKLEAVPDISTAQTLLPPPYLTWPQQPRRLCDCWLSKNLIQYRKLTPAVYNNIKYIRSLSTHNSCFTTIMNYERVFL